VEFDSQFLDTLLSFERGEDTGRRKYFRNKFCDSKDSSFSSPYVFRVDKLFFDYAYSLAKIPSRKNPETFRRVQELKSGKFRKVQVIKSGKFRKVQALSCSEKPSR
jgi:hypothetical protein